jgi:hypothetical protein
MEVLMSQEENERTDEVVVPRRVDRRKNSFWARKRRKSIKTVVKTKKEKELKEAEERYEHAGRDRLLRD